MKPPQYFNGRRAWEDIRAQMEMGPRFKGSPGHNQIRRWLEEELEKIGWSVRVQEGEIYGHTIYNIIAYKNANNKPEIIVGAHYDTRMWADRDPDPGNRRDPVPGANDGASGTAVLLELARVLPEHAQNSIWLVFFDAEDNGRIPGWDWILGSRYFAREMDFIPGAVVIVDMVGDADLELQQEINSDTLLKQQIWDEARQQGYGKIFISDEKYSLLDDHTPFLQRDIPSVVIIDFDYPYWHTTEDTLDKVSPESLKAVGDTLLAWLRIVTKDD